MPEPPERLGSVFENRAISIKYWAENPLASGAIRMSPVPTARVFASRRTFPLAVVTALLAVTLLGVLGPAARAAPAPPFFSPAVQVDQSPAHAGGPQTPAGGADGW